VPCFAQIAVAFVRTRWDGHCSRSVSSTDPSPVVRLPKVLTRLRLSPPAPYRLNFFFLLFHLNFHKGSLPATSRPRRRHEPMRPHHAGCIVLHCSGIFLLWLGVKSRAELLHQGVRGSRSAEPRPQAPRTSSHRREGTSVPEVFKNLVDTYYPGIGTVGNEREAWTRRSRSDLPSSPPGSARRISLEPFTCVPQPENHPRALCMAAGSLAEPPSRRTDPPRCATPLSGSHPLLCRLHRTCQLSLYLQQPSSRQPIRMLSFWHISIQDPLLGTRVLEIVLHLVDNLGISCGYIHLSP